MMSQRTEALYQAQRPSAARTGFPTSLAELVHEVVVGVKFGISKDDLREQLRINDELLDSLLEDMRLEAV